VFQGLINLELRVHLYLISCCRPICETEGTAMRPQLGLNEARVTDSTQPKRLSTVTVVMITQRASRTPPAGTTAIQFSPSKVSSSWRQVPWPHSFNFFAHPPFLPSPSQAYLSSLTSSLFLHILRSSSFRPSCSLDPKNDALSTRRN
jgi:hypothetical protein